MLLTLLGTIAELPPNRDYVTTGGLIITTLLTVIGGVLGTLIQSNRKLTRRGMEAAESAADRSEPTGNGFAKNVQASLARIEQVQRQQGRDIGGMREEIRTERQERIGLVTELRDHIKESRKK